MCLLILSWSTTNALKDVGGHVLNLSREFANAQCLGGCVTKGDVVRAKTVEEQVDEGWSNLKTREHLEAFEADQREVTGLHSRTEKEDYCQDRSGDRTQPG